jgi:hypothetical protein
MKNKNFKMLDIKWLKQDSNQGFNILEGINRDIKPGGITKIAMAVDKFGDIIRPIVVANLTYKGKKGLYIIDGQHLYFALLRLNLPIPYLVTEINNDEELVEKLAMANTTSKSWTLNDYIQVWSYIKADYKTLQHHIKRSDLEVSTVAAILQNQPTSSMTSYIKKGQFNVKDVDRAIKIMDYVTDYLKVIPRQDRTENKKAVVCYLTHVLHNGDKYNHKKCLNYLKANKKRLEFLNASKEDVLEFFNEISY